MNVLEILQRVGAAGRLRHDVVNVTPARDNATADAADALVASDHL